MKIEFIADAIHAALTEAKEKVVPALTSARDLPAAFRFGASGGAAD